MRKLAIVALVSTLFVAGGVFAQQKAGKDGVYEELNFFDEAFERIRQDSVDSVSDTKLIDAAISGMLTGLDPRSSFLDEAAYKAMQNPANDNVAGVGMVVTIENGQLKVISPQDGSPAAQAGVSAGDFIESIKGVATRDMPLAYAEETLHGEPGSTIEISLFKSRRPDPQKVVLTRAAVVYPPVHSEMMSGQIGYIRPDTLATGKVKDVAAAVTDLQKQGAKRLVLDLRNCAVGDMQDGVVLADLFLDKGLVTYLQGQRSPRQDFKADPSKNITNTSWLPSAWRV